MDVETQEILNALFRADEETLESILRARPPREREMIRSELDSGKTISNKERAASRKSIQTESESLSNRYAYILLLLMPSITWGQTALDWIAPLIDL